MKKSSANPVEIKTLDKVHVLECGMGIAHSIFIARNESEADEKAISTYGILDQSDLDWNKRNSHLLLYIKYIFMNIRWYCHLMINENK